VTKTDTAAPAPRAAPKAAYLDAAARERQIVAAAIAFVARRGLYFTTRELADEIGISQPLLYRYFASKADLMNRIYDEVYLKRWDPRWLVALADRAVPVRDRLSAYLRDYTAAILDENWIRIFMASALADPSLSRRYLDMLHESTFPLILEEIAEEAGVELRPDPAAQGLARDVVWGFHSSFFYLGVRKFIYRLPIPEDLDALIALRVAVFLDGMTAAGLTALAEPRR
jgi:AcrR family transcriptional regulator